MTLAWGQRSEALFGLAESAFFLAGTCGRRLLAVGHLVLTDLEAAEEHRELTHAPSKQPAYASASAGRRPTQRRLEMS